MKPLAVSNDYHPEALRRFNIDVDEHEMTVLLDQGLYRHLRFKKPGTGMYYFDIITTPGQLTIRSDMGTYVYAREQDMFPWFNGSYVNAGYWGEKLQAIDTHCGYRKHDEDAYRRWVIQHFWDRREQYEPAVAAEIWADIRDSLFDDYGDQTTKVACMETLDRFRSHGFIYRDTWDNDWTEYSYQYLWCCHAILAGIRHYNDARLAEAA